MKNIVVFIFLFLPIINNSNIILAQNCDINIPATVIIVDGNETTINPGDVVCFDGGNKDFLLLKNIHGTASEPIILKNTNGAVIINTEHNYGFKIANCSFVKILGNGDENVKYGFQIQKVTNGAGVSMDELTTDIELSFTEIGNTEIAGLYAKSDPDCSFTSSRDNFTMYNLEIHDCYIHDTKDEGFYIGHSKYQQGVHLDECDTLIYPHVIRGVRIYNNILEHLGWDGIQVSSADQDCKIYDNIIRYDSERETTYQMSGILIGGGSKCDCYNNQIFDGKGDGIDVLGLGDMKIYNNLIVRAGRTFKPNDQNATKHGIYVGSVVTISNLEFKFFNNTIVSPKSYGITYNNSVAAKGRFYNNLILDPGKKSIGDNAFINNLTTASKVDLVNNIFVYDISDVWFKSYSSDNFDLKLGSPAVNFGYNMTNQGITFDILNRARPYETYFDVGAFEWQGPDAINDNNIDINMIDEIYPNPTTKSINFNINLKQSQSIYCTLISLDGITIKKDRFFCEANMVQHINIELNKMDSAIYLLKISTENGFVTKKIIVQ